MNSIETRGISFQNEELSGRNFKSAVSISNDPDVYFISQFTSISTLAEIMKKVDMAINGDFDLINDEDVSNNVDIAFITKNGIEHYDETGQIVTGVTSFEDFKEIATAWYIFLQERPFHGERLNKPVDLRVRCILLIILLLLIYWLLIHPIIFKR